MTKTVCDICGKELTTTKDWSFYISSYGKVWDICDECLAVVVPEDIEIQSEKEKYE